MRTLVIAAVMIATCATAATAAAGPLEDQLTACRTDAARGRAALRDAQTARTAYEAKLAELLAELREQLDQSRNQLAIVTQERDRLEAQAASRTPPPTPPSAKTP